MSKTKKKSAQKWLNVEKRILERKYGEYKEQKKNEWNTDNNRRERKRKRKNKFVALMEVR